MQTTKRLALKGGLSEDLIFCQKCGNGYVVLWVIKPEDYKDFGLRHCPFCGLMVDEDGKVPP